MEANLGVGRGSYIWGRSVHNTRIECLWYDVTQGYNTKWKNLFINLELYYGLIPENPAHIWLLHLLFLPSINQDAQDWAQAWNSHVIELSDETDRSPRDLFFFGLVRHGPHSLGWASQAQDDEHLPSDEVAAYGVDWELMDDRHMMEHLLVNNPQDWADHNPFTPPLPSQPDRLSYVECEPPDTSLPAEAAELLLAQLRASSRFNFPSRSMDVCKLIWTEALMICGRLHGIYTHGI
ncbi:hypothetical protein OE88DRAFT_1639824 [Heliocybe sulcata]|uniref:Integrase core domain-containing protein n=1 Tax=Heliocybe sulcata TaxID=5364 RepID=A0A5C3MMI3_9AGAM|nr:hypothetical protein OE88DRAFT_1639824 [Heliocybe sulcata]